MGYYTKYSLHCDNPADDRAIRAAITAERHGRGFWCGTPCAGPYDGSPFMEDTNWNDGDGCKWYNHHKDCERVSQNHPLIEFTVRGEGEEGEIWENTYFAGGSVHYNAIHPSESQLEHERYQAQHGETQRDVVPKTCEPIYDKPGTVGMFYKKLRR